MRPGTTQVQIYKLNGFYSKLPDEKLWALSWKYEYAEATP
jgi:hypothetical protein